MRGQLELRRDTVGRLLRRLAVRVAQLDVDRLDAIAVLLEDAVTDLTMDRAGVAA